MPQEKHRSMLMRFAILVAIFLVTNLVAFPQSTSLKTEILEEPYHALAPSQSLQWFITSTFSPSHLAGVAFVSGGGTAVNRPQEYGTQWKGFGDRVGTGMATSAVGNGIEAGLGEILREDPRYFRTSQKPFNARVENVVRLTFSARGSTGGFGPAYARYMGILGGNLLSNTWRVHSEANVQSALLRSSEGFGGRMAANAFEEFWPDLKKRVLHKRSRVRQGSLENAE
jgi:hypothetical protein